MSTLRNAAQQALDMLDAIRIDGMPEDDVAIALRAALAEPVQEPYAWMAVGGSIWRHKTSEDDVPLYTVPPKSKPLTEEEINALELPPSGTATVRDLVRLIERAHGIE